MFLPNLSPSSLMQTSGTSPVYCYSSSAPDTILRPYLHTNEPFQNNFSNVFGTNRLFSDMPVQQHLLLIARAFFVLNPEETCLSLSAGMPLTSSGPCPSLQAGEECWGLRHEATGGHAGKSTCTYCPSCNWSSGGLESITSSLGASVSLTQAWK